MKRSIVASYEHRASGDRCGAQDGKRLRGTPDYPPITLIERDKHSRGDVDRPAKKYLAVSRGRRSDAAASRVAVRHHGVPNKRARRPIQPVTMPILGRKRQ